MKDKPNKLDDIIREKMSDLGSAYQPATWDLLNDRLDTLAKSPESLDDIVRNKMADLNVNYRPETWDWLNERLDGLEEGTAADGEMQPMDEVIYEQMHRLEKPYDPTHWPLLLKKLEANALVGKRIVRYKAMELSLLLLLLITFVRLPISTERQQVLPDSPAVQQERPQATITPDTELEEFDQVNSLALNHTNNKETLESADLQAQELNTPIKFAEQSIQDAGRVENRIDQLGTTNQANSLSNPAPNSLITLPDLAILPASQRELATPKQKIDIATFLKAEESNNSTVLAINPAANALGVMSYLPTTLMQPLCQTCIEKLDQKVLSAKRETFFRIGFQGGPDYNRVITPTTIIKGKEYGADRYSLGYSGGLTFGLERGRWEIETGLIYSNKRYFSLPVVVLDGSVQSGFFGDGTKQFDLDMLQIPLNFRYNFIRKNKWRVYALAGMSLHVASQSNYYLANPDGFETNNYRPQPISPGQTNPGSNVPSVRSEFDNFTKGWLEGGAFNKNSYLSGNVGIGIEYFITDHWSLYGQPTYGHSLIYLYDGLGPYFDRIHTNSLNFGIKVRLK